MCGDPYLTGDRYRFVPQHLVIFNSPVLFIDRRIAFDPYSQHLSSISSVIRFATAGMPGKWLTRAGFLGLGNAALSVRNANRRSYSGVVNDLGWRTSRIEHTSNLKSSPGLFASV
jgi:hypothetical protein